MSVGLPMPAETDGWVAADWHAEAARQQKRAEAAEQVLQKIYQCLEDDGRVHWCCRENIRALTRASAG